VGWSYRHRQRDSTRARGRARQKGADFR